MIEDLRKLAARQSRSVTAVEGLDLDDLQATLEEAVEAVVELIDARDEYVQNDPAEASGTDEKEMAREARTEAWENIQTHADNLADLLEKIGGMV